MFLMPDATVLTWKKHAPRIASDVFIASGARLMGQLEIGNQSSIWFNTVLRGDVNYIRIGTRTNVQDNTTVHVDSRKYPTIIGNDVTIGHNAIIHACSIGDGALIGMGAIILDGAEIPEQALVAAGSLVSPGKKYPPRMLLRGSPAVAVRALNAEELGHLARSAVHYANLAESYHALSRLVS